MSDPCVHWQARADATIIALTTERDALAVERDAALAKNAALVDGIGRIAEQRLGICPLCDEHWMQHGMPCPLRSSS